MSIVSPYRFEMIDESRQLDNVDRKDGEASNWMGHAADLEVELVLLPTEHGGRQGPAISGYRPQFYYDGEDFDAVQSYPDQDAVSPGESARAYLYLLNPELHAGRVRPGKPFLIREGQRVIGYGSIRQVLNPSLKA